MDDLLLQLPPQSLARIMQQMQTQQAQQAQQPVQGLWNRPVPQPPPQPLNVQPFGSNPHGSIDANGMVHGM